MISGLFADILQSNRPVLNARFAEAQRLHSGLDAHSFTAILRELVAPVIAAIEAFNPALTEGPALALYDLALDLLGKSLLGPESRYPCIELGWKDLLPKLPAQLSAEPRLVAGSISNAIYNLSQVPGARPQQWIDSMQVLGSLASDPHLLLQAGKVAAWRAGLAHLRKGALEICRSLEPGIVRAALCLAPGGSIDSRLIERLEADPWLDPESAEKQSDHACTLKIVRRVGSFRGFGGLFLMPPRVFPAGEHFLILDGETHWLLVADVFGATLHRVDGMPASDGTGSFKIDQAGNVHMGKLQWKFDELAGYSSAAGNQSTLAVTSPLSFAISLVAPVED